MRNNGKGKGAPLPFVRVSSLAKSYGRGMHRTAALRGVDFSASAGTVTGILGLNGAGKSTLLKAVCGIHYPSEGSVDVCGRTDADSIRPLVASVPELPLLDKRLSVRETLYFAAAAHGVPKEDIAASVLSAAARCGLLDVLGSRIGQLSKGYAQRTSLAAAIASGCPVLVLDEFSSGLDPAQLAQVRQLLTELAQSKCVIFSTHRIEEAESLCGSIYILAAGRIAAFGSAESLLRQTGCASLEEAFLSVVEAEGRK